MNFEKPRVSSKREAYVEGLTDFEKENFEKELTTEEQERYIDLKKWHREECDLINKLLQSGELEKIQERADDPEIIKKSEELDRLKEKLGDPLMKLLERSKK